jgi:hypothetical protein
MGFSTIRGQSSSRETSKRTASPAPGRRPSALSGRRTGAGYEAAALPRRLPDRSIRQAQSKIAFAVAQAQ